MSERDYVLKRCPECLGQADSGMAIHFGDCPNRDRIWVPEEVSVDWPSTTQEAAGLVETYFSNRPHEAV